ALPENAHVDPTGAQAQGGLQVFHDACTLRTGKAKAVLHDIEHYLRALACAARTRFAASTRSAGLAGLRLVIRLPGHLCILGSFAAVHTGVALPLEKRADLVLAEIRR